ncbi:uncharacterized protein J3D65DRAFT_463022 [Phyllosticta citribraziliensis]|uniref:CID domain-containing protein n=1 Tax=Phyllosticta citribraziliensis TaxID=989973 RepID=A0ABR1LFD0_9PEZI
MSLPSAEVAADFREALQDLKFNSRPEISNLTIIAKENTEHAQAISRELENHIKTTRPEWKLPALYVLDSIVKNVGTPYTVYLGSNLYDTFVNAYTLVDTPTRKALEGLLRTWKQPVPESMDTRPVIPVEVTRKIDNVLLKFKTVAMQAQQNQTRSPAPGQDPRVTQSPYGYNPGNPARQSPAQNGMPYPPPPAAPQARDSPAPSMTLPFGMPPQSVRQSPVPGLPFPTPAGPSAEKIKADVERLIASAKLDFANSPYDAERQKRLKTFLDLQVLLNSQQLPPSHLQLVEQQLAQLGAAVAQPSASASIPSANTPGPLRPLPFSIPTPSMPMPQMPQIPTPVQQSSTPVPTMNSGVPPSLADMLRGINRSATPQQAQPPPPPIPTAPSVAPAATPINTLSLLDTLRAQGLLGGSGTPMAAPVVPVPVYGRTSATNDVELTKESIKRPRPELISLLYEARPNQCSTCGRRFPATDDGKVMKRRHLDWHFKVRDPNLVKQAIHRSWYIGEKEWIDYREQDEAKPPPETNGMNASAPKNQQRFVRVPLDPELVNAPCPICQEKFTPSRLDDEFVWMDAIQVGPKIYHNSCYEEVYGKARSTPVLGKRGADEGTGTPSKKMHI